MTKQVAIVEDNEAIMEMFQYLLTTFPDVEIISEVRGDSGLELIKSSNPDLIILDINLPGKNGIEICQELRKIEKFRETPILAVTAFTMKGDKKMVMDAGFTQYISKPINVVEFRNTIAEIIG